jgi:nucleotide-binding universal stress UspA family protein
VTGDQAVTQRRIVAGVDGSEPSDAALAWAVHQAKLTGGVVEAVIA